MGRKSTYNAKDAAEIYGLLDPRTGALRYIGKAANAERRFKAHMREMRRRTPVYDWIARLRSAELQPILVILERCVEDWPEAERRHIAGARARGERLLNVADGGDQPHCPIEVRRENAVSLNLRLRSDPMASKIRDMKRALANGLRHGHVSNRARANMRQAAALNPARFGEWANLQDREENADGSPIQVHG